MADGMIISGDIPLTENSTVSQVFESFDEDEKNALYLIIGLILDNRLGLDAWSLWKLFKMDHPKLDLVVYLLKEAANER